ncbi:MAG: rhomboid family intramembrane serine protease [Chitinophagales bacterium]
MIPLKDRVPSQHFPLVTLLLIIINVLVFIHEIMLGNSDLQLFLNQYGLVPTRVTNPSNNLILTFTPFITSMFLHGGWMHLIGNMWALWLFGDNVEDRMGPLNFTFFYLIIGIIAGATQVYVDPSSQIPTVGASGAIAGVMGAYFVLYPRAKILTLVPIFFFFWLIDIPAFIYLAIWIILQIFGSLAPQTGGVAQIAFSAHIGGFIAGLILHRLFMTPENGKDYY